MIFLHFFETDASFEESYNGEEYKEPWVSLTKENDEVNYDKKKYEPLTFNILSDGKIGWKAKNSSSVKTIQYSKNGGEWTDITSTTGGTTIPVVTGDVLKFKGETWPGSTSSNYSQFTSTCTFAASGNPGSLKYGEVTYGDEPLANYCYFSMFNGCTGLTTAPELPATALAERCYQQMFNGCASLATAPELPATKLAENCYDNMFYGCTGLTTAPSVLPATTLKSYCYYCMFNDCENLTTAPALPATTLANKCYQYMFRGCTSLTTAPALPATTLANYCYQYMFSGCTSLNYIKAMFTTTPSASYTKGWVISVASTGTFIKNSAAAWNVTGDNGVPSGWTVQTAAS